MSAPDQSAHRTNVSLFTIVKQWTRLGVIGFGGPPAHIALLRRLCVDDRAWIQPEEFEDAIATVNLLPGPASTQLAIFCAWYQRKAIGAVLGGICFIVPGLVLILLLSAVFLAHHPPHVILGAAEGAGAAVPAVALSAAASFVKASRLRMGGAVHQQIRWFVYAVLGAVGAATIGPFLVLVLIACGVVEVTVRQNVARSLTSTRVIVGTLVAHSISLGGLGALAWVALKVGALSYGGGFVIIPLMQHDAVTTYHWMTGTQFLNAVALGQVTPGPVVLTTAAVGYAADGLRGGLFATLIAFLPSFLFVLFGAGQFNRIRENQLIQAFLTGAGPAVIGAIAGSAIPLGLAFQQLWQIAVLAGALVWFFVFRRGAVSGLLVGGGVGVALALCGVAV